MKPRRLVKTSLLLVVGLAAAPVARAASPAAEYDRLFGAEEKRVVATPDTKDDATLAIKIMAAAEKTKDDHDFQSFLYRRSFDLAVKDVTGLATAQQAIDLLAPLDASGAAELRKHYSDSLKTLYQKAPRADKEAVAKVYLQRLLDDGDGLTHARKFPEAKALYQQAQSVDTSARTNRRSDIQAHLKVLESHVEMQRKFDALVAKLAKSPQDKSLARDLALMCASEREDLPEAARYAEQSGDDALKRDIALAQTDAKSLSEDDCLTLADWYKTLPEHGGPSRTAMLLKAIALYGQYLDTHQKEDAQRLSAVAARDAAQSEIDHAEAAGGNSIDLLALVELPKDTINGSYRRDDKSLAGSGAVYVPVKITGNYHIQGKFTRVAGDALIEIKLPVNEREFGIGFSFDAERRSGIKNMPLQAGRKPPYVEGFSIVNGQPYNLDVTVSTQGTAARCSVSLNDKLLATWEGDVSEVPTNFYKKPMHVVMFSQQNIIWQGLSLKMTAGSVDRDPSSGH